MCQFNVNALLHSTIDPIFVLTPDGKRVGVDDYGKDKYKFMPNDKVYLYSSGTREGPYTIETTKDGKYTLCDDDGKPLNDGETYEEADLALCDPFAARS